MTDKQQNENQNTDQNDVENGKLYKCVNGELIELVIDPEELRKVKLRNDAIENVITLQKEMRSYLNGYKPDLTLICSALIATGAKSETAKKVVADYWFSLVAEAKENLS